MYPLQIKEKYDGNQLQKLSHRFTTAYLWNYINGDFREYVWSHPWVDIQPITPHQEVFCVLDGTVYKAWEEWAFGKHVFIEHKWVPDPDNFSATTTLYSCYLHLSEISVNVWEQVSEWTIIGKTGNTGNSYWEHLHFQIDRKEAPFHAYWPYTSQESKAAGKDFMGAVNAGLWLDKAKIYTVNPLVYLNNLEIHRAGNGTSTIVKVPVDNGQNDTLQKPIIKDNEEKIQNNVVVWETLVAGNQWTVANTSKEPIITTTTSVEKKAVVTEKKEEILSRDAIVLDDGSDLLASLNGEPMDKKKCNF